MDRPHVLLISLDTVRRDFLGCYGYPKTLTPHLDRLAETGVRMEHCIANCGWTLPQHMTLFTGLYPPTHQCVLLRGEAPLHEGWTTLPQQLMAHGYRTFAGVTLNRYGGGVPYGFARGFDERQVAPEHNRHMPFSERFAIEAFERNHAKGPCFVYLHIHDSHEPWAPPEPWLSMHGGSFQNLYEGELNYVDHHLGEIFTALKRMGIFEKTLIVLFADHGTEFAEHGFVEKKVNLYQEILRVPLMFHWPEALPAGRAVSGLCESAQVAPTILELLGLPPLPGQQGESLAPRLRGQGGAALKRVCSHTRHEHQRDGGPAQFDHWAIQTERYKFIRLELFADPGELHADWKWRMQALMVRARRDPASLKAGTVVCELFDLQKDPRESFNLLAEQPTPPRWAHDLAPEEAIRIADGLESELNSWIRAATAAAKEPAEAKR